MSGELERVKAELAEAKAHVEGFVNAGATMARRCREAEAERDELKGELAIQALGPSPTAELARLRQLLDAEAAEVAILRLVIQRAKTMPTYTLKDGREIVYFPDLLAILEEADAPPQAAKKSGEAGVGATDCPAEVVDETAHARSRTASANRFSPLHPSPSSEAAGETVRVRACVAQTGKRWAVAGSSTESDLDARAYAQDALDVRDSDVVTFSWLEASVPVPVEQTVEARLVSASPDEGREETRGERKTDG